MYLAGGKPGKISTKIQKVAIPQDRHAEERSEIQTSRSRKFLSLLPVAIRMSYPTAGRGT
jgi:hypothetical protein